MGGFLTDKKCQYGAQSLKCPQGLFSFLIIPINLLCSKSDSPTWCERSIKLTMSWIILWGGWGGGGGGAQEKTRTTEFPLKLEHPFVSSFTVPKIKCLNEIKQAMQGMYVYTEGRPPPPPKSLGLSNGYLPIIGIWHFTKQGYANFFEIVSIHSIWWAAPVYSAQRSDFNPNVLVHNSYLQVKSQFFGYEFKPRVCGASPSQVWNTCVV